MAGCFKHGKHSGFVKGMELFVDLGDCWFLENGCTPMNQQADVTFLNKVK
jgi:hypothetical protein